MYSFLLESRIKPETDYDFYTYKGKDPVTVEFRGNPVVIDTGQRFGVRKSSNGKMIRLVLPDNVNRVLTIDIPTATKLAKGITPGGK
jgi:hypothetical protein